MGKGSPECICFPEDEQPFFCYPVQERVAARLKCPLHGDRFKVPRFYLYVAKWYREKEPLRIRKKSPQYQKAWSAGFPPDLWPATLAISSSLI
jgi:endonuclease I